VALFFITVGLLFGSYLTVKEVLNVFAANDTVKTWTFNSASDVGSSYTKSLVTVDDTGAHPTGGAVGANKLIIHLLQLIIHLGVYQRLHQQVGW